MIQGDNMGGKTLLLLGLIVSALFIYLCIDSKKDTLYAQLHPAPPPTAIKIVEKPKPKPVPKLVSKPQKPAIEQIEMKAPSFAYISTKTPKIVAYLSRKDENSTTSQAFDNICHNEQCVKEIRFLKDRKPCQFTHEAVGLISYMNKEKIKNFTLLIDKDTVSIEGKLTKQEQLETINPYLDAFRNKGYTILNELQKKDLAPIVTEEIIKEEVVKVAEDEFVVLSHMSTDEAATKIHDILVQHPVTFAYSSSQISDESKQTLDQVSDLLLGLDDVSIEVAGYTDSKGDAVYNKVLSQKRADAVRKYLIQAGVRPKIIKSVGYGEENPISNPKDIINRRVEIHLKEGV